MTGSVAEPCPHLPEGPVLRRLADVLPPPVPVVSKPPPFAPPAVSPTASVQVERVLRAAVEILGGRRPARQLAAVLRPDLLTYLTALHVVTGPLRPRVHKVIARYQGTQALEAVAVVALSTGVRALAARFEEHRDDTGSRWQCTALQLRLTTGDMAVRGRGRPG